MKQEDREAVLQVTASVPFLITRLFFSYLRMRRSANLARKNFYRELVQGGMPVEEARCLADEYADGISLRTMLRAMSSFRSG